MENSLIKTIQILMYIYWHVCVIFWVQYYVAKYTSSILKECLRFFFNMLFFLTQQSHNFSICPDDYCWYLHHWFEWTSVAYFLPTFLSLFPATPPSRPADAWRPRRPSPLHPAASPRPSTPGSPGGEEFKHLTGQKMGKKETSQQLMI